MLVKKLKNQNYYTYGLNPKSNFYIKNIKQNKKFSQFDLNINLPNKKKIKITSIKIPLIGLHNIRNSVAATAVSLTIGISIHDIKKGLSNFGGVQRRFNKIFTFNKIDFYDDYAHHPTEIINVLDGVEKVYNGFEKVCIFQPHRLSRVKDKSGAEKYEEPTFKFAKRVANRDGATNPAPKLIDTDGNTLDTLVGNGSDVTVKFKPYSNDFGTFAELVAVKVNNLVEYGEADPDNEEF